MKLYHCKKCNSYSTTCYAVVTFRSTVEIESSGDERLGEEIDYLYDRKLKDITTRTCCNCENENDEENPVEIIDIQKDACPHEWEYRLSVRHCRLCGEEQRGTIYF